MTERHVEIRLNGAICKAQNITCKDCFSPDQANVEFPKKRRKTF